MRHRRCMPPRQVGRIIGSADAPSEAMAWCVEKQKSGLPTTRPQHQSAGSDGRAAGEDYHHMEPSSCSSRLWDTPLSELLPRTGRTADLDGEQVRTLLGQVPFLPALSDERQIDESHQEL